MHYKEQYWDKSFSSPTNPYVNDCYIISMNQAKNCVLSIHLSTIDLQWNLINQDTTLDFSPLCWDKLKIQEYNTENNTNVQVK